MAGKIDLSVLDITDLPATGVTEVLSETDKKMICLLLAIGEPLDVAVHKLKLQQHLVENYVKSFEGTEQVIRMQSSLFPDPHLRLKRSAHIAIDTSMRLLLTSKSEATLAKVSADMMDRSMGKATQIVETRNINFNASDMQSVDRALTAQKDRLERLLEMQQKLTSAQESK